MKTIYIKRADAICQIMEDLRPEESHDQKTFNSGLRWAAGIIVSMPEADVAPVVRGEWKINADGYYPYCSACKEEPTGRCMTAYCPSCGAKMDGGTQDAVD